MKVRKMLMAVLVLVALLALPLVGNAQEPDPVQMYKDMLAKLEAGDIDGALAYYSEDHVGALIPAPPGGSGIINGNDEERARMEEVYALNPRHEIWDCETSGNTTTCAASYEGDDTRSMGIGPIEFVIEFVVEDGLITSDTWTMTDESLAALTAVMAALPETGGAAFPVQAVMVGLGGLAVAGGAILARRRGRSG